LAGTPLARLSPLARLGGRLVLASHNAGKLREIRTLLSGYGLEITSAADHGLPEPEETGTTFAANARLKAQATARATGLPALADDSGLCVAALGGEPGIYSARWAGPDKDFAAAMALIETKLQAHGAVDPALRRAWFISALALVWPDDTALEAEGRVDGTLVWPVRGVQGFGYDPMFLPDGHARTFGEMSADEKHGLPADGGPGLSHRARAFQNLQQALEQVPAFGV
jgi:XTP/dITP diphosphohydrolase